MQMNAQKNNETARTRTCLILRQLWELKRALRFFSSRAAVRHNCSRWASVMLPKTAPFKHSDIQEKKKKKEKKGGTKQYTSKMTA